MQRRENWIEYYKSLSTSSTPFEYKHFYIQVKKISKALSSHSEFFANEYEIIRKFTYKSKNQHKSSIQYQRLKHIERVLTRFNELDPYTMLDVMSKRKIENYEFLLEYFTALNTLITLFNEYVVPTAILLNQSIATTHFLTLYLTWSVVIARFSYLIDEFHLHVEPLFLLLQSKPEIETQQASSIPLKRVKEDSSEDERHGIMDWLNSNSNSTLGQL